MATALCPGSFDPVTLGHLDIIERSARHFDEIIVAVIRNPQKTQSLFSLEERQQMLKEATAHVANVRIEFFKGLLVDFAKEHVKLQQLGVITTRPSTRDSVSPP